MSMIAISFNYSKCFTMDVLTGDVYTAALFGNPESAVNACPPYDPSTPGMDARDGVLRWFEHFARLVDADVYGFSNLESDADETLGLSLFPEREAPFDASEAVIPWDMP